MIEAVMYFAIGFLAATLVALLTLPAVWHRAVRLTTKRIEGAIPVSMAEFQADKDQLRAGFAMAARRLELVVDRLKDRNALQLAEIAEQTEKARLLALAGDESAGRIASLEAERDDLMRRLLAGEAEIGNRGAALAGLEQRLAGTEAELAAEAARLDEKSALAASLQVEMVALTTQRDMLSDRVADLQRELDSIRAAHATLEAQFAELRLAASETATSLAVEQSRASDLGTRLADAESHLADSRDEAAALARTIAAIQNGSAVPPAPVEAVAARANGAATDEADALLRARISDIAAEVARLTAALEGPSSPILSIVGADSEKTDSQDGAPSLADRIRALQTRAAAG